MANYAKHALMFGDGAKDYHIQVYGIYRIEEGKESFDTGIRETAIKASHNAAWKSTIAVGDTEHATLDAAIAAYEASQ